MATTNLKLTIRKPGTLLGSEINFQAVAASNDYLRIPRRYPFADIANLSALRSAGFFRHALTGGVLPVSTELGGSTSSNADTTLGYQIPPTEKLVLLLRRTGVATSGTPAQTITLEGSLQYGIPDKVITFEADAGFIAGTKLYEIDLYDLGLLIGGVAGESGASIKVTSASSIDKLEFALIARTA